MDPISIILLALTTGAAVAAKDVSARVVKDAYEGLKTLVVRKFGDKADVQTSIRQVEEKPDSEGRKATLKEELAAAGADKDNQIVEQAKSLLELLKQHDPSTLSTYTATVTGSGALAQDHSTAAGAGGTAIGGNARVSGPLPTPPKSDVGDNG